MYTLSHEQSAKVGGGVCPVCLATAAGAAIGASGVTLALTSHQILLFAAGSLILSSSMVWAMYHSDISAFSETL